MLKTCRFHTSEEKYADMSITKKTVNDVRRRVYQIVHPIILLKSKLQSRYDVLSPTDRRYLHRGHPFVVKSPAVKGSRSERHPYNGDLYHQLFSRRNDNVRYLDKLCVHDRMSKIFTCSTKCAIFRQQKGSLKRGILDGAQKSSPWFTSVPSPQVATDAKNVTRELQQPATT